MVSRFEFSTISRLIILSIIIHASLYSLAQQQMTLDQYIERYKDIAMEEMRNNGIPASIKLAQGILESGFGNSDLARIGKNHFGIKCHGWQGRTFTKDDDHKDECFRAYDDPHQSFRDHSQFLRTRAHYAPLFELDIMDYKGWARGLRQSGYATNPRYPDLLIGIIERNNLQRFDQMALRPLASQPQAPVVQPARVVTAPSTSKAADERAATTASLDIRRNNRIRYVYARPGDTPERIAAEAGIWAREIYRYNEMGRSQSLVPGQIVYLQPKRRSADEKYHIVKDGETLYEISQQYGVRLYNLYKRNGMEPGTQLRRGQKIYLKGRAQR
jgi:hypothetical protein